MPVTYLTRSRSELEQVLDYVCDPKKTVFRYPVRDDSGNDTENELRLISGINCSPQVASEQFQRTKDLWSRIRGVDLTRKPSCIRGYISFTEGETDPLTSHRIAMELAEKMWGEKCEVVVATHVNTANPHTHFVINSIRMTDGLRLHDEIRHIEIKKAADRICREHGISVREEQYGRKASRNEYEAERNGKPTLKNLIRWDIDAAVIDSFTVTELEDTLKALGYRIDLNDKRPVIRPPGSVHDYSLKLLGSEYALPRIRERILENRERPGSETDLRREEAAEAMKSILLQRPDGSMYDSFRIYKEYLDIRLRYTGCSGPLPYLLRADIIHLDKLEGSVLLMEKEGLFTREDLDIFVQAKTAEYERLHAQRDILTASRHIKGKEKMYSTLAKMITPVLREIRKDIQTAGYIADNQERIEMNLSLLRKQERLLTQQNDIRKEEMGDGKLLVGSGGPGREDCSGRNRDRGEAGWIRS